eukprot:TRINITY_DN13610_c3_g1_i1.p1 TRINITY_DN13610_c3_g1~~TRINITY_DN13610_c3_g1_i1.p1  ORF type:complete len:468 (+),score=53.74 TRINITY_DN13610_c3_g1_i1:56-1459(+)
MMQVYFSRLPSLSILVCLTFQLQFANVASTFTEGHASVLQNSTSFLSKFCFAYDKEQTAGYFDIELSELKVSGPVDGSTSAVLVLLDDQEESYPDSDGGQWNSYTCEEKQHHARWKQPIVLQVPSMTISVPMHQKVRPRWWFVAVIGCSNVSSEISFNYKVHTLNPTLGSQSELSWDQLGVIEISMFFLLVNVVLTLSQFYANALVSGTSRESHPIIRILSAGLFCGSCSHLAYACHYRILAVNGRGLPIVNIFGKFMQSSAKFLLMSILLLVSRGNCVSKELDLKSLPGLLLILGGFSLLSFSLEVWGEFSQSRTFTTDFVYSTSCGHLLILLDLALLAVYATNVQRSLAAEKDPERRSFYKTWGVAFGVWFLSLPAVAILAHLIAPWVEFRIVLIVVDIFQAVTFAALVTGLWPTKDKPLLRLELEMETFASGEGAEGYGAVNARSGGFCKGWQPLSAGPEDGDF